MNGSPVDDFISCVDEGGNLVNPSSFVEREIANVAQETAELIEIVGTKDASEPLRTDYLDFTLDHFNMHDDMIA